MLVSTRQSYNHHSFTYCFIGRQFIQILIFGSLKETKNWPVVRSPSSANPPSQTRRLCVPVSALTHPRTEPGQSENIAGNVLNFIAKQLPTFYEFAKGVVHKGSLQIIPAFQPLPLSSFVHFNVCNQTDIKWLTEATQWGSNVQSFRSDNKTAR